MCVGIPADRRQQPQLLGEQVAQGRLGEFCLPGGTHRLPAVQRHEDEARVALGDDEPQAAHFPNESGSPRRRLGRREIDGAG